MKYDIVETDFRQQNTSAYQLSILAGMDSLVYSVYDTDSSQLLLLKNSLPIHRYASDDDPQVSALESFIKQEKPLATLYRRVKIAFCGMPAAVVPARLFNENEKETYLGQILSEPGKDPVFADDAEALLAKVVYSVEGPTREILKRCFPTARFYHEATPFLLGCKQFQGHNRTKAAYAGFGMSEFLLAVFEKENLLFFNRFPFHAAEDVLYFLLLTYEQLGLSAETDPLYLSGQILEEADIYKLLFRYFSSVSFASPKDFVTFGSGASAVHPSLFFHLHSLLLCK